MGRKGRKPQKEVELNMSSMIDVVFLLIIFFVVTASMDKEIQDERVMLAASPHGKVLESSPKGAFYVNVLEDGTFTVDGMTVDAAQLRVLLQNFRHANGEEVPVVIRGDNRVKQGYVTRVEDVITSTSLYKVRYNAEKKDFNK